MCSGSVRLAGETPEEYRRYLEDHPIARNRSSTVGRSAVDMRTHQIPDVLKDADYGRPDLQRLAGFRTLLATPMILRDEVVGVISLWRTDVSPFNDRERGLLEEFAAEGAIVLRQVELMHALESKRTELASKVAQLEALREVGEAVGSSLDLDEVLATRSWQQRSAAQPEPTADRSWSTTSPATRSTSAPPSAAAVTYWNNCGRSRSTGNPLWSVGPHSPAGLSRSPTSLQAELDPHLDILFQGRLALRACGPPAARRQDGWRAGDPARGPLGLSHPRCPSCSRRFATQSALAIVNARLFRELQTKTEELEIASRHKSEFLASMSHELRTPLNAVIGFSEVLLDRMFGEINERQDEYLHDIRNSGRHLLELLNEILDLSKVEAGQMVLEPSTFRVDSALEYTLAMVRERAALHAITVTMDVADDVEMVDADELRFKQVVLNLVSNAVKFTPDGGSVSIRAYREGTALVVTVTDTGIGVPPEDQERIFESFQQGRRGAPKEEGTGLGLTLSRRIVGLFGGRMWLESTPGVGSTFGFSVPGLPEQRDEVAWPGRGELPVVVLVDDDRASLDLLSAYLDGSPARVLRARDGVEALEVVRRVLPAAVVLDIKLPRLDGWQVLAELKADSATADIPVVIASVVDDRSRGLALGADEYLLKPVHRDALVDALRHVGALASGLSSSESS